MNQMSKAILGCIVLIPLGIILIWVGIAVFLPLGLGFYSSVFMFVAFGIVAKTRIIFFSFLILYLLKVHIAGKANSASDFNENSFELVWK